MRELPPIVRAIQELNFLSTVLHGGAVDSGTRATPDSAIPVTIFSGFLGAGKTTLLKRILGGNHGRRLAVIVNDFGAVNIDAAEISRHHGDVVELTNGCSCCAMGGDFVNALARVIDVTEPPEHIMVEASGLSDPSALATLAAGSRLCRHVGVVTLVDAMSFLELERLPIGHMFERQLEAAHAIVLTKTGPIASKAVSAIKANLAARFPGRRIWTDADFDPGMAFRAAALGARPEPSHADHDLSAVVTHHIDARRKWSVEQLRGHLACMPHGILRLKGWLPLHDGSEASLQCVGRHHEIEVKHADPAHAGLVMIALRRDEAECASWGRAFSDSSLE